MKEESGSMRREEAWEGKEAGDDVKGGGGGVK